MEWVPKRTASNPQWVEFVSACKIEYGAEEQVWFRAQFRASMLKTVGAATIRLSSVYNAAITVGGERIFALDADDTPHTNKKGVGRPWFRKTLPGRYHLHHWCDEGYGYAEPVDENLNDIQLLVDRFLGLANLTLIGEFVHPLRGQQPSLFEDEVP